jgi:hypothetical protein
MSFFEFGRGRSLPGATRVSLSEWFTLAAQIRDKVKRRRRPSVVPNHRAREVDPDY